MNASLVTLVFGASVLVFLSPLAAAQETESPPAETAPEQEGGDPWDQDHSSEHVMWPVVDPSSNTGPSTEEPTIVEEAADTQDDTTQQESRASKGSSKHAGHSRTAHHAKARTAAKASTGAKARTAAKKTARAVAN